MTDVALRSFAGIRNTETPERLHNLPDRNNGSVDLTAAVNVDIDDSGNIARRAGQTMKVPGPAHSLWASLRNCLFIAGTSLNRLNPDFTTLLLATGLTPGAQASYVEVGGRVYWTNGVQTGIVDGMCRSWGMAAVDSPHVLPIAGSLTAGTYQAVYTQIRRDGQESGCGLPAHVTLGDASGVRFSWPNPQDPDIVSVALYLTEPNGMVLYQAGVFPIGAGSADVTGPDLALPLNTQWLDAPPAGQCLAYQNGRILIGSGPFVFGTTALGPEYVDMRDYLSIDGSAVGLIVGVRHGLYIGTEKAVYFASGERLEDYTLQTVVDGPCVPRTGLTADGMAVTGNKELSEQQVAMFATARGICYGTEDGNLVNLTQARYRFDAAATGAAYFRDDPVLKQYLLMQPPPAPIAFLPPPLPVPPVPPANNTAWGVAVLELFTLGAIGLSDGQAEGEVVLLPLSLAGALASAPGPIDGAVVLAPLTLGGIGLQVGQGEGEVVLALWSLSGSIASSSVTAPTPVPGDILNSDGTVNTASYVAMAGAMPQDAGVQYRFGPSAQDLGTPAYTTTLFEPTHHLFRPNSPTYWEIGGPNEYLDSDPNNAGRAGAYSTNQGNFIFLQDDPNARTGCAQLQQSAHEFNVGEISPQLPWQINGIAGSGIDSETTITYRNGGQLPAGTQPICCGRPKQKPGFSNEGIAVYSNGLVCAVGSNTARNKGYCFLDAHKVPTAIAVSNMSEFAFITVWDTVALKGQLAVVALAGLCDSADPNNPATWYDWWGEWLGIYPGLPNMGNWAYMKLLGYVDLPFMAPTSIACTNGLDPFNEFVGGEFFGRAISPLSNATNWQSCATGGAHASRFAKGGMAVVCSKSEQKIAFLDLKPLFMGFYNQYFTSGGNPATATFGPADNQWPFTFANTPSFAPTVTKTLTLTQRPTAVYTSAQLTSTSRAWVGTQDGTVQIYSMGLYVPAGTVSTTQTPADIALKGSVTVGANPTCLTAVKSDTGLTSAATLDDCVMAVSRGERKIQWIQFAADGNSGAVVRTVQDSRMVDPIWADDNDNFANRLNVVSVADYAAKTVRNYRYGLIAFAESGTAPSGDAWNCQWPTGCPVTPTSGIQVEYGGGFLMPGKPYMIAGGNVP